MISIKKLATVGAAAGLLFGSAMPVLAWDGFPGSGQVNFARVWNNVTASSNTGGNSVNGNSDNNAIVTGDAATIVGVSNKVNKNVSVGCGCVDFQLNAARIGNRVSASSNSGYNSVNGNSDDNVIVTGSAGTGVAVSNVVNKNVSVGWWD